MIFLRRRFFLLGALSILMPGQEPRVKVVNMIPFTFSGEANHDTEPSLAVNPRNELQMAAAVMAHNQIDYTDYGPVYVSTDNGNSWRIEKLLPTVPFSTFTYADATVSFSRRTANPVLYAAMLKSNGAAARPLNVLQMPFPPPLTNPAPMSPFQNWKRTGVDQPYLQATTVTVSGQAKDLIFVGIDDRKKSPLTARTATMDQFSSSNSFPSVLIDTPPPNRNEAVGGVVRVATAFTNTQQAVFAAFFARRTLQGNNLATDVMVVGDTTQGGHVRAFALKRKVTNALLPTTTVFLGGDRAGPDLAIAIHPTNRQIIYVAWGDKPLNSPYTLHVRRSVDGGLNWPNQDVIVRTNAKNPALALNSAGTIGFLYQELTGEGSEQFWETHFETFVPGFMAGANPSEEWLLSKSKVPANPIVPYLGDYIQLSSVNLTFYGVFVANNLHTQGTFPLGVDVKRKMTGAKLVDLQNTEVPYSLDPYFFRVRPPQ